MHLVCINRARCNHMRKFKLTIGAQTPIAGDHWANHYAAPDALNWNFLLKPLINKGAGIILSDGTIFGCGMHEAPKEDETPRSAVYK